MEYLVVRFDVSRRVLVNGNPFGLTNAIIQIDAGTHQVALLPPPSDFSPLAQTVLVKDTSPLAPLTITFQRLAAAPPPPAAPSTPPRSAPVAPVPAAPAPVSTAAKKPAPAKPAPKKPA